MTEANLDSNLRGLPTSLTNRCTVFIVRRGLFTISEKKQQTTKKATNSYTAYLATLGATSSVAEFDKVCCTQFEEKPLYNYKACISTPSRFHVL